MRSTPDTLTQATSRRGARSNQILLVVAAILAIGALVVMPEDWRWPTIWGVAAGGATLSRMLTRPRWASRIALCLIGGLLTVAAVTVWHPQTSAYGVAAATVAVVFYPAFRLAEPWYEGDRRRRQVFGFLRGLAIGTAIAVAVLVILGLFEHYQASFAMRYGEQVTVTVDPSCANLRGARCDGSTWTVDGRTYVGQLLLGSGEAAGTHKDAFVVPGETRAYSPSHYSAYIDGLEIYGFMPAWPGLAILVLMVLVALPSRFWRRLRLNRARSRTGVEASP